MYLFNLPEAEILCFFAVLVRYTTLIAVAPILGDRFIPGPVKILLGLLITAILYPMLVQSRFIDPNEALVWGATAGGIASTVALEALVGLALGFTAKLLFDSINFGANLLGTMMGFAAASTFDPHQESQTQVVAEMQMALATLIFLVLDGHHLMIRAALDSYEVLGLGQASVGAVAKQQWVTMSSQVIMFGVQLVAPVAICLFGINVAFGIMAKAMPQANLLVLSFSVTSLVGLVVMFISMPHYATTAGGIFEHMGDWMGGMSRALSVK